MSDQPHVELGCCADCRTLVGPPGYLPDEGSRHVPCAKRPNRGHLNPFGVFSADQAAVRAGTVSRLPPKGDRTDPSWGMVPEGPRRPRKRATTTRKTRRKRR